MASLMTGFWWLRSGNSSSLCPPSTTLILDLRSVSPEVATCHSAYRRFRSAIPIIFGQVLEARTVQRDAIIVARVNASNGTFV